MVPRKRKDTLMKATTLLEQQHRKVRTIFRKLQSGRSDPKPLLEQLANELSAHMVIEHELFYPAAAGFDREQISEAFEEHALAELAIKRLIATDPEDEAFHARVVAAKELVEHHVKEEEEVLFPKAEKKLGEEKLNTLGKEMKARFQEAVEAGFEATVPKGQAKTAADMASKKLANKREKKRAA
jgi:iron-sulfur cluster repair protein YtfE (RIC family)